MCASAWALLTSRAAVDTPCPSWGLVEGKTPWTLARLCRGTVSTPPEGPASLCFSWYWMALPFRPGPRRGRSASGPPRCRPGRGWGGGLPGSSCPREEGRAIPRKTLCPSRPWPGPPGLLWEQTCPAWEVWEPGRAASALRLPSVPGLGPATLPDMPRGLRGDSAGGNLAPSLCVHVPRATWGSLPTTITLAWPRGTEAAPTL